MPTRRCPACTRRLPYAGRRCIHCGWNARAEAAPRRSRRVRRRVITGALVLLGLWVVGVAYQNAEQLAGWYAAFAARHLPSGASSLAPTGTTTGAFFYCARQVARRMEDEHSVQTFPPQSDSRFTELGEDRFRVESFVEEVKEDGRQLRIDFTCTVRYARGRWQLEQLAMQG